MLHASVQKFSQRKRFIIVHIPPRNDNILNDPFQKQTSEIINHKIQLISDNVWQKTDDGRKKATKRKLLNLLEIHECSCTYSIVLHIRKYIFRYINIKKTGK